MFHQFYSLPIQDNIRRAMRQAKNKAKLSYCLICNAEARIINYGALSCYSCKTFFRRHIFRIKVCIDFFVLNEYHSSSVLEYSFMSICRSL
jgi:hypothetical protein